LVWTFTFRICKDRRRDSKQSIPRVAVDVREAKKNVNQSFLKVDIRKLCGFGSNLAGPFKASMTSLSVSIPRSNSVHNSFKSDWLIPSSFPLYLMSDHRIVSIQYTLHFVEVNSAEKEREAGETEKQERHERTRSRRDMKMRTYLSSNF
jgi:hypothetical protein